MIPMGLIYSLPEQVGSYRLFYTSLGPAPRFLRRTFSGLRSLGREWNRDRREAFQVLGLCLHRRRCQMSPLRTSLRRVVSLSLSAIVAGLSIASAQTPSPGRLLVLLRDASALAIVDPASGTILGRVPTGRDPHEVTASADGRLAFVASMVDGISVIDIAAQEEIRRVDPGPGSRTHDVLFAGGKVYFTIEGYKSIGRYDPSTNEIDWTLGIGQDGTHLLVLNPETNTLFMPNTGSNSVTMAENIMAGPSESKLTVIPVPGELPEGIDLSPDGREIWTATRTTAACRSSMLRAGRSYKHSTWG